MNFSFLPRLLLLYFSLVAVVRANEPWVTLNDCRLLPNRANDGDSFHVRAAGREYIFRLYFVDAPETDASLPGRVAAQAKYFGVSIPQTLQIGLEAERFTRQKLAQPFTVRTCNQDARGRSRLPRYFAFVQTGSGDLAEQLVANGLARVFGAASDAPGMNAPEAEWRKLKQLQRKARQEKLGGWGIGAGRLNVRAASLPGARFDHFDAFVHPNGTPPSSPGASTGALSAGKLDINSTGIETLEGLPGIGPVLATRIIDARPFKSADELQRVKGIGAKKYAQLRLYFE